MTHVSSIHHFKPFAIILQANLVNIVLIVMTTKVSACLSSIIHYYRIVRVASCLLQAIVISSLSLIICITQTFSYNFRFLIIFSAYLIAFITLVDALKLPIN